MLLREDDSLAKSLRTRKDYVLVEDEGVDGCFRWRKQYIPEHKGKVNHGTFLELQVGQVNYSSGCV